jgi:cytochrome c oxidase cbb3-type subunit 3
MSQPNHEQDRLTGHAYDGIEEYDNPLPRWWSWIFALSIVFAVLYFSITTLSGGQLSAQAYYDRAVAAELKKQMAGGLLKADAATLLNLSKDSETLQAGQSIFATNCVACHNRDGSGLIGPNLTDDFYLHLRKIEDIPDVVTKGRNNGAMPAWGNRLSPNEVVQVSAFVASLRGQNKPSARPKEGIEIPPWSAK